MTSGILACCSSRRIPSGINRMRCDGNRCAVLGRDDEFEPRWQVAKRVDRISAQPHLGRDAGMGELQGDIPLVHHPAARE